MEDKTDKIPALKELKSQWGGRLAEKVTSALASDLKELSRTGPEATG